MLTAVLVPGKRRVIFLGVLVLSSSIMACSGSARFASVTPSAATSGSVAKLDFTLTPLKDASPTAIGVTHPKPDDIAVYFDGVAPGYGVGLATRGTPVVARIIVTNRSTSPWSVSFDYFIVTNDQGGKRVVGRPLGYSDFASGVWDWQRTNPAAPSSVAVPGGDVGQLKLEWRLVDQNGAQVSSGTYFAFVPVNGGRGGYAEATIAVP